MLLVMTAKIKKITQKIFLMHLVVNVMVNAKVDAKVKEKMTKIRKAVVVMMTMIVMRTRTKRMTMNTMMMKHYGQQLRIFQCQRLC